MFLEFLEGYRGDLVSALHSIDDGQVEEFCEVLLVARKEERRVFLLGNGGSSATPSHIAGDWAKVLGIRAMCLSDNTPFLTATANDVDYSEVFRDQLRVFMDPGDVVIAFSGSGNSPNVIKAVEWAREHGATTVGFTGDYKGQGGGSLARLVEIAVVAQTTSMERIEDLHLVLCHIIKEYLRGRSVRGGHP